MLSMNIKFVISQIRNYLRQFMSLAWQISIVGVCLCLLLILSSCQATQSQDNGVIHLTLWQGINPPVNRDVFQKLVDKFNQTHPNIQVESIYAGQLDQQLPKVLTAVVGNVPPDILTYYPQITGQLVELGAIRPLEDWLEKLPIKSEIIPNLFEELQLKGHIWSVPLYTSNMGIFIDQTYLKQQE